MTGRIAVVTGAASGMGRLATQRLVASGWTVAAVDLPGPQLEAVSTEIGAISYPCDVTDPEEISSTAEAIVSRFGPVDRLVNAAGIAISGRIEKLSDDSFERSMPVNYLGTVG